MDTRTLEEVGLTKNEATIYIALLELGASRAGEIIKKTNVQNSVLHFTINTLIEKGLVSYVKKGTARIYDAATPDTLVNALDEKRKRLKEVLPQLKQLQITKNTKQQTELFEGERGVHTALYQLIENAKKGEEFLFFAADESQGNEDIQTFYKRFDAKRKDGGLRTKGIAPLRLKKLFENRKGLDMMYVEFPIPENTGICGNKMAIITWGERPQAILIHSRSIVEKQKKFFEQIWNYAKNNNKRGRIS